MGTKSSWFFRTTKTFYEIESKATLDLPKQWDLLVNILFLNTVIYTTMFYRNHSSVMHMWAYLRVTRALYGIKLLLIIIIIIII